MQVKDAIIYLVQGYIYNFCCFIAFQHRKSSTATYLFQGVLLIFMGNRSTRFLLIILSCISIHLFFNSWKRTDKFWMDIRPHFSSIPFFSRGKLWGSYWSPKLHKMYKFIHILNTQLTTNQDYLHNYNLCKKRKVKKQGHGNKVWNVRDNATLD